MAGLVATWVKVAATQQLRRSSHTVNAVGSSLYVFGGELKPREPRDNDVHQIQLTDAAKVSSTPATADSPSPRVGSATTTLGGKIYMFSGRGGVAMSPVEEGGGLWVYDPASHGWSLLKPSTASHPEARSYHAMASDGDGVIYVHAGCPEKGRLSDLWAFTLATQAWKQLASAPGPARGGTSIAFARGQLYRMNGFDGQTEQGGSLDVYDASTDRWRTLPYRADGRAGPCARSVAALLSVTVAGRAWLVTPFGEGDPSALGHQGAGKMIGDVWAYDVEKEEWGPVSTDSGPQPDARGWFDADVVSVDGKESIVVVGGLGESNERLDDVWMLKFSEER